MEQGRHLIVALDNTPIAGAKSCSFDISQSFITACSPFNGRVKTKIPTDYDWGVSVDCLIPSSALPNNLIDKLIAGTKCFLTFTDGSNQQRAGDVYVKSCKENGNVGSLATFNAAFESSGALYKYQKPVPAAFQEGEGVGLYISDNTFSFTDSGNTLGVGFSVSKTSTAIIKTHSKWAVVDLPFNNDLKDAVFHQDTRPFEGHEVAVGTINATFQLAAGTYTVLVDKDTFNPFNLIILTE